MFRRLILAVMVIVCSSFAMGAQQPAPGPIPTPIPKATANPISLQSIASGLTAPVDMAFAPGDPSKIFVVEQPGQIKTVINGVVQPTPFLDLTGTIVPMRAGYDERGLLGLAFDPKFNDSTSTGFHRLFTWESLPTAPNPTYPLTTPGSLDHQQALVSYKISASNPNVVDTSTRQILYTSYHPSFNHDGGTLAFGPGGYLFFGEGDGGGGNDFNSGANTGHNPTIGNAQDVNSPLGKVHRIDVYGNNSANGLYGIPSDNPFAAGGGVKEIYAKGFRNPYRFSFDGNRLIMADVGQDNIEEIDDVVLGGNYGWNVKEGTFPFTPSTGNIGPNAPGSPAGLIDPLAEYDHDEGIAIVGGFVYHGIKLPFLQGKYVFGDFSKSFSSPQGRLFFADLNNGDIREFALTGGDLPLGMFVKGMGRGPDGEIYLMASTVLAPTGTTGQILALVPEPATLGLVGFTLFFMVRRKRAPKKSSGVVASATTSS
jgi:glucose/arabinose dehydrogenase